MNTHENAGLHALPEPVYLPEEQRTDGRKPNLFGQLWGCLDPVHEDTAFMRSAKAISLSARTQPIVPLGGC
jgi:hypothetical protein